MIKKLWVLLLLTACAGVPVVDMSGFEYSEIDGNGYKIATWQRLSDKNGPVHIYIEGDGHAFDANGRPTTNPTPRGDFVRSLAVRDAETNVVYMARPCQFVMSDSCNVSDWTSGRFSADIINAMADAVHQVVQRRPIILIGYSGGAMVSGLMIAKHPELNVQKWITIAGVLNHSDWTAFFNDRPLTKSLDLDELPHVKQLHYIGSDDDIVPNSLSFKWVDDTESIIMLNDVSHDGFDNVVLNLSI